MPELPEVETTARGIRPWLQGQIIKDVRVHHRGLRWPVPLELKQVLRNQVVRSVWRRGKYLILQTAVADVLIHLGMSGSLRIDRDDRARRAHDHLEWQLANATLRYHDPRRFGFVLLTENAREHPLLKRLGPEPLASGFTAEYLFRRSRRRRQAVKNFIMDSRVVAGVGNIYANEALFAAGIWPQAAAGRLALKTYRRLVWAVRHILRQAIEAGGTTLQDFVNADGQPGYFAQSLMIYGRAGERCPQCGTLVRQVVIGQRSSFFCVNCQKTGRHRRNL